jgi:beta-galactosidase
MNHRFGKGHIVVLFVFLCFAGPGFSQTTVLKHKAAFNQGWKFIKSDPGTAAAGTTYSDASWASVNIPHSPSYDSPAGTAEQNYYVGTCWYRKTFYLPANVKKAFLEFEAAMQVATVYVNGTQVGLHDNSGYTPFTIDISNQLVRGGNNVLAVRLNNAKSADIPPGWGSSGPDYNLYGGLHRSVWLHLKDSVYIPVYAQQVIPMPNAAATSSQLRVKTPVMNTAKTAQNATVTVSLFNASNALVISTTATRSIPAEKQYTFDTTSASFSSSPWSPQMPNMYSVRTIVTVGGLIIDSIAEPCGFRTFTWSATNGFSVNGTRTEIKGVCVHQALGWIENAVPDQRYDYEVKVIKAMGCNSIRCSHYPRCRAFYDACDKLGMLVYPELPTWGWSLVPNAACWTRLDSCAREMVVSGRNHPCIYAWGLYNEPNGATNPPDFSPFLMTMNNTVHANDSTRPTALAANGFANCATVPDVIGLNYNLSISGTANGKNAADMPWFGCESRNPGTFGTKCFRGSAEDLDTSDVQSGANDAVEWASFNFTTATSGHLAGGHFWCWKDYNSAWSPGAAEGIVDPYDVPKTLYYYIAKKWNPTYVTDYPRPGTSAKIDFKADTNSLPADSVNVFLLTAAMRDAGNHLISNACNIQFTLSDPTKGVIFCGNTVTALGGLAAAFLRTSKSAGTFTVTAAASCNTSIPSQTVTLTTTAVPAEVYTELGSAIRTPLHRLQPDRLTVKSGAMGFLFKCPQSSAGALRIIDIRGRTAFSSAVPKGALVYVKSSSLGAGTFCAIWGDAGRQLVVRINNM